MESKASPSVEVDLPSIATLRWQCRRGMLELDLLLMPFLEKNYLSLSSDEKKTFMTLLNFPDQTLYSWFLSGKHCEEQGLRKMIQKILDSKQGVSSEQ